MLNYLEQRYLLYSLSSSIMDPDPNLFGIVLFNARWMIRKRSSIQIRIQIYLNKES
jgi:hypothetical protein